MKKIYSLERKKLTNRFLVLLCITILLISGTATLQAQTISALVDLPGLLQNKEIEVFNRNISPLKDNPQGIHLDAKSGDGVAWIKNSTFKEGTITFDVRGKDVMQQSFVGMAFHGKNDSTFDVIYFRPFNFQSPDPARKSHAVQYVSLPDWDWEKLRTQFPGKHENAINPAPSPNEWIHCSIKIKDEMVYVYVNNITEPVLTVKKISPTIQGKIGFWVGNNSDGDFANLSVSITKN
ncbi:hypothetical protein QTN47_07185 [Danxiaibacter flavus]|uniref:3-keto-disaccharide hydrolase domain-containing protein n=1 Tax=Danxiaibacter flavus TaxID=3049108 RepID=A0ABV3ZBN2_9BACT|nr:hypothetical protein QNM32_07185 [Chitinophagaceae bacterium DXS]